MQGSTFCTAILLQDASTPFGVNSTFSLLTWTYTLEQSRALMSVMHCLQSLDVLGGVDGVWEGGGVWGLGWGVSAQDGVDPATPFIHLYPFISSSSLLIS